MKRKLKILLKSSTFLYNYPFKKISKFKKSKWKELKKDILQIQKRRWQKYYNLKLSRVGYRYWSKTRRYYRQGLAIKTSLFNYFDNSFSIKTVKRTIRNLKDKNMVSSVLLKPFFRLNILLWKLGLFASTRDADQMIKYNKIEVNNKVIKRNLLLKKGDIIKLLFLKDLTKTCKFVKKNFLFSFCEIDPYTNTIVILKNHFELSKKDLSIIFRDTLDLKNLTFYINKK